MPDPAVVGQTCCQTEQIVGRLLAVVAIEEEFLTEVAGIAEVCPGIAVVEAWLVVALLAVAAVVEA